MSPTNQASVDEPPSVLLAFIHDEPTLPERLALSKSTKKDHKERLKRMEKDISNLVGIVQPHNTAYSSLHQA